MSPTTRTTRGRQHAGRRCPDAETLIAYVDCDLPPDVRGWVEAHAAHCAYCQAAIVKEEQWNSAIRSAFVAENETACPTDEQLSAYVDGGLSGQEQTGVHDHVEQCEECRQQVKVLREISRLNVQDLSALPRDLSEAAAASVSQVHKCLDRMRELLHSRVHLRASICGIPGWIEQDPAQFERDVVTLSLVLFYPQHKEATVQVSLDGFCLSSTGIAVEIKQGGCVQLRRGGENEHFRGIPDLLLSQSHGRWVLSPILSERLVGMMIAKPEELKMVAEQYPPKPPTREDLMRLWQVASRDPEHPRLELLKGLKSYLRPSFESRSGSTPWPVADLNQAIQRTRELFGSGQQQAL